MAKIIIGKKYQYYDENGKFRLFRTVKGMSKDRVLCYDADTNTYDTKTISELNDKYVELMYDAVMVTAIGTDAKGSKDVYVMAFTAKTFNSDGLPEIIIRQDVLDEDNPDKATTKIPLGYLMFSPYERDPAKVGAFIDGNGIKLSDINTIALYVDDKTEDIELLLNQTNKKYTEVFNTIKATYTTLPVSGICENITHLVKHKEFISYFRLMFNIVPIPVEIPANNDGLFKLDQALEYFISAYLNSNMFDIRCIKYAKDIDIAKIIEQKHIMVSDVHENIFLMVYTEINNS